MPIEKPARSIGAAALAGALSAIVVWVLNDGFGVDVPPTIASSITTVVTFATGYFVAD